MPGTLLALRCPDTPFPPPDLRNTGLANGNTDKHRGSFKLMTAEGGVPETLVVPLKPSVASCFYNCSLAHGSSK